MRNATTRPFESTIRATKAINTNRKEGHLQQVRRQAFLQAIHHIARGDPWDAVVVDKQTKRVVKVVRCFPGPKLVDLITKKYPSLNPYVSSTATAKDQGSSISVQDDEIYRNLSLNKELVSCRVAFRGEASRRPMEVQLQLAGQAGEEVRSITTHRQGVRNSTVLCPPVAQYEAARALFNQPPMPAGWYRPHNLLAYKALDVRSIAPAGDPKGFKMFTITGELDCGNYVTVSLPSG